MNHEHFKVDPRIWVDTKYKAVNALRCLLHTILFNRSLADELDPTDIECDSLDIIYTCSSNKQLHTKIGHFLQSNITPFTESIKLTFHVETDKDGWFSKKKKIPFEVWQIPLTIYDCKKYGGLQIANGMHKSIVCVMNQLNKNKHLPPITYFDKQLGCYHFTLEAIEMDGGLSTSSPLQTKARELMQDFKWMLKQAPVFKI